jgi:hypothetical protein
MTRATFIKELEAFTVRNGKKPNALLCDREDKEYEQLEEFCIFVNIDIYVCFAIPFTEPKFIII